MSPVYNKYPAVDEENVFPPEIRAGIDLRGTLDNSVDIFSLTKVSDNGYWVVPSANSNPNLPATPGVAGKLTVQNTANDKFLKVDFRSGGGSYVAYGSPALSNWDRVDNPFSYKGSLPDETDINSMRSSRRWNGIWILSSTSKYPNAPLPTPHGSPAMLINMATGLGDTYQRVIYRFGGGDFDRKQVGTTTFSDWVEYGSGSGGGGDVSELEARVAILEASSTTLKTTFETNKVFTTYQEGEVFMDRLASIHKSKLRILNLGTSTMGRNVRAFEMGDPTKPTFYIMASQHGSEPMGREAAYIWVRELCSDNSTETQNFLNNYCVVVTPVVNVDMINVQRLSSSGTDLNANWSTESTKEIQAASWVLKNRNVVVTMDAHEGGLWKTMQADYPTAPEVAASIRTASAELYNYVEGAYSAASEAFARFNGSVELTQARNVIAHRYKSSTILFEGSSDLDANMYSPDVIYRINSYMVAYRSVFAYVRSNMTKLIAAKASA